METTELERFRTDLEKLRDELRHQLDELGVAPDGSTIEGEGYDPGFADSAHSTAERANLLALSERLRDQLGEVEAALVKVAEGSFGTCASCSNPIPRERLEALPYSALCVTCKQKTAV